MSPVCEWPGLCLASLAQPTQTAARDRACLDQITNFGQTCKRNARWGQTLTCMAATAGFPMTTFAQQNGLQNTAKKNYMLSTVSEQQRTKAA